MKKMNNKGFSLVELIIVIAIMAILAGALAPALIKYIAKSRRSSDANNCGTIQQAIQTAMSDETAASNVPATLTAGWVQVSTQSNSDAFWSVVDGDLSGGLTAFADAKTNKLTDGTSVSGGVYVAALSSKGDVHVGVKFGNTVYECVPTLDEKMGGKAGTTTSFTPGS